MTNSNRFGQACTIGGPNPNGLRFPGFLLTQLGYISINQSRTGVSMTNKLSRYKFIPKEISRHCKFHAQMMVRAQNINAALSCTLEIVFIRRSVILNVDFFVNSVHSNIRCVHNVAHFIFLIKLLKLIKFFFQDDNSHLKSSNKTQKNRTGASLK